MATDFEMSRNQVSGLVRACRERGLLTMSTQGKIGGELTEKAEALLDEMRGPDDGEH